MLELETLRADMLAQDKRLRREGWLLIVAAIGGAGGLLVAGGTIAKLFL